MKAKEKTITEKEYEEMLNEIYPEVCLGNGLVFTAGRIIRELDPIAFRCGIADEPIKYCCSECEQVYDDKEEAEECCKKNEVD